MSKKKKSKLYSWKKSDAESYLNFLCPTNDAKLTWFQSKMVCSWWLMLKDVVVIVGLPLGCNEALSSKKDFELDFCAWFGQKVKNFEKCKMSH